MVILATQNPVFKPAMRIISSITNANPAVVTTTFAHNYVTGCIVRLIIPLGYGMMQANQLHAPITVTSSTTFTIAIDTLNFPPFTTPITSPLDDQYAQCIPIGEVNGSLLSSYKNVLPY